MHFTLSEVAEVCGGRIVANPAGAGGDVVVDGASIDSRTIRAGQLFVPVVAERDGHEFIDAAVKAGATAYLTGHPVPSAGGVPAVVVADTAAALRRLGEAARARLPGPVVGVTGSVGKTSVKDLAAAALGAAMVTAASEKSFNNELGVPLTLCAAPEHCAAAVIEMGSRGAGHIALLCEIARPTIGVVTRVAPAHLELFGSLQAVARAKAELVESLPAGPAGVAVLNAEDPLVLAMADRSPADPLSYGDGGDVRAERVSFDARARASFELASPWGHGHVRLPVSGAHMVANALAALAAGLSAGAPLAVAIDGIEAARLSPWRMEINRAAGGATVLNDAYNASPLAMRAAFDTLVRLDPAGPSGGGRRVAVLGRMAELGDGELVAHREVAAEAAVRGIDVYAVGTDLYDVAGPRCWPDIDTALDGLAALDLGPADVVLVKASRVVGLERLAARLVGAGPPR